MTASDNNQSIEIKRNGPYLVKGNILLVRKTQVVSEYGEPLTWKKEETLEKPMGDYELCRCGQSENKPFCDGTHGAVKFEGSERADTDLTIDRQMTFRGGTRLIVNKDPSLCMSSGFCGMQKASLSDYIADCDDTEARLIAISMVERCPSGALTFHIEVGETDIEPDLPVQIADTTEFTSDGPIMGPLWVTGGIPVVRSDGEPFETRNRVTLCNCGFSGNRPLCDGTHRYEAQHLSRLR